MLFNRLALLLLSCAVCVQGGQTAAWAYINGGIFHSTFEDFKKKMTDDHWSVGYGAIHRQGDAANRSPFGDPDSPEFQKRVNEIVGWAIAQLPENEARALSKETKREIARLAQETIATSGAKREQIIEKGQIGTLHYQLGTFHFSSYWETNYGNRRRQEGHRSGLIPFVALKITADGTP